MKENLIVRLPLEIEPRQPHLLYCQYQHCYPASQAPEDGMAKLINWRIYNINVTRKWKPHVISKILQSEASIPYIGWNKGSFSFSFFLSNFFCLFLLLLLPPFCWLYFFTQEIFSSFQLYVNLYKCHKNNYIIGLYQLTRKLFIWGSDNRKRI